MRNRVAAGAALLLIVVAVMFFTVRGATAPTGTVDDDGQQVAYLLVREDGNDTRQLLYVQDIDEAQPVLLARDVNEPVQWQPSGDALYYIDQNTRDLITLDVSSGDSSTVWRDVATFAWSPRGDQLAWVEDAVEEPRLLYVGDPMSEDTAAMPLSVYQPSWSPDGTRIAFVTEDELGVDALAAELAILDVDSGEVEVIEREGAQSRPVWSPDGGSLLFYDNNYDESFGALRNHNVLIYEFDSGSITDLDHVVFRGKRVAWGKDADRILTTDDARGINIELDTAGAELAPHLTGDFPVWNADNDLIAYEGGLGRDRQLCVESLNVAAYGESRCFNIKGATIFPIQWRP